MSLDVRFGFEVGKKIELELGLGLGFAKPKPNPANFRKNGFFKF